MPPSRPAGGRWRPALPRRPRVWQAHGVHRTGSERHLKRQPLISRYPAGGRRYGDSTREHRQWHRQRTPVVPRWGSHSDTGGPLPPTPPKPPPPESCTRAPPPPPQPQPTPAVRSDGAMPSNAMPSRVPPGVVPQSAAPFSLTLARIEAADQAATAALLRSFRFGVAGGTSEYHRSLPSAGAPPSPPMSPPTEPLLHPPISTGLCPRFSETVWNHDESSASSCCLLTFSASAAGQCV